MPQGRNGLAASASSAVGPRWGHQIGSFSARRCRRQAFPAKRGRRQARKTTGDDWPLQADGPIVAPRPQLGGKASCGPEADIMPTLRSRPDAVEECRHEPARSRRPRRASARRARRTHGCRCPEWRRDGRVRALPQPLACRLNSLAGPHTSTSAGLASNRRRVCTAPPPPPSSTDPQTDGSFG